MATAVILYICGVSEAVRQTLEPLNVRTTFKPKMTLSKALVRMNDRVQINKKTQPLSAIVTLDRRLKL